MADMTTHKEAPKRDVLEQDIRHLFSNSGQLDRDEVAMLLLGLLKRIQQLEDANGIKGEA